MAAARLPHLPQLRIALLRLRVGRQRLRRGPLPGLRQRRARPVRHRRRLRRHRHRPRRAEDVGGPAVRRARASSPRAVCKPARRAHNVVLPYPHGSGFGGTDHRLGTAQPSSPARPASTPPFLARQPSDTAERLHAKGHGVDCVRGNSTQSVVLEPGQQHEVLASLAIGASRRQAQSALHRSSFDAMPPRARAVPPMVRRSPGPLRRFTVSLDQPAREPPGQTPPPGLPPRVKRSKSACQASNR